MKIVVISFLMVGFVCRNILNKIKYFHLFQQFHRMSLLQHNNQLPKQPEIGKYIPQPNFEDDQMLLDQLDTQFQLTHQQFQKTFPAAMHSNHSNTICWDQYRLEDALFESSDDEEELKHKKMIMKVQKTKESQELQEESVFVYEDLVNRLQQALLKVKEKKTSKIKHGGCGKLNEAKKHSDNELYQVKQEAIRIQLQKKLMVNSTRLKINNNSQHHEQSSVLYSDRKKKCEDKTVRHKTIHAELAQQKTCEIVRKPDIPRPRRNYMQADWKEKKSRKEQQMLQKRQELMMKEATFTPQINEKSKMLMKRRGEALPIFQRLVKSTKLEVTDININKPKK